MKLLVSIHFSSLVFTLSNVVYLFYKYTALCVVILTLVELVTPIHDEPAV